VWKRLLGENVQTQHIFWVKTQRPRDANGCRLMTTANAAVGSDCRHHQFTVQVVIGAGNMLSVPLFTVVWMEDLLSSSVVLALRGTYVEPLLFSFVSNCSQAGACEQPVGPFR
jgi:hypothetical protein